MQISYKGFATILFGIVGKKESAVAHQSTCGMHNKTDTEENSQISEQSQQNITCSHAFWLQVVGEVFQNCQQVQNLLQAWHHVTSHSPTKITGLSSRRCTHVQHCLLLLRCKGDTGQHGRATLQHVVTGQVLRRGTLKQHKYKKQTAQATILATGHRDNKEHQ